MIKIIKRSFEVLTKKKLLLASFALLFTFPIATPSVYYLSLLTEMLIWALLAMSYDLALGYTSLVSFGHAAPFGIGAYVVALLLRMNFPFLLAVLIAILFGALVGLALGIFTFRVSGIYYALVTLAFAEMIFAIFNKWVELSGGETGLSVPRPEFLRFDLIIYAMFVISIAIVIMLFLTILRDLANKNKAIKNKIAYCAFIAAVLAILIYSFPSKLNILLEGSIREKNTMIMVTNTYYLIALLPIAICYLIAKRIIDSPMGKIFVAIRENEERTKMLGYDVPIYKLIASIISSMFASLAGALYTPFALSISPYSVLSSAIMINILLYNILGGLGTLVGPMLGAGIITLLANELTSIRGIGEYWMLVLGVFYIVVILFFPYGIVITWKLKRVSVKKNIKKIATLIKTSIRGK
ncbi:MAG: branched-chain amino acid ABC transporter permease [Candidatus Bathyarchaeia archaeon]